MADPANESLLLAAVRTALAEHLLASEEDRLIALEQLQTIRRPYSTVRILRVETARGSRRLVMKTTAHHPVNQAIIDRENQALVEYNILKRVHPSFVDLEQCSVPRPILVLPELETYLMDFVEGHLLAEEQRFVHYLAPRSGFESLKRNYHHCGQWLKRFQEVTGRRIGGREVLAGVLGRAEHRLKLIEESGDPRCPRGFRDHVLRFLERQSGFLSEPAIPVSGRHSDFGPWNVIAGPRGITVIDFFGYQEEPVLVDLLKVLVYLEDEKRGFLDSGRRLEALQKSFISGYGPLPPFYPGLSLLCEAMQRVVSIWGSIADPGTRPAARLKAHRKLKANLRWLLREGGRRPLLLSPGPGGGPLAESGQPCPAGAAAEES